MLEAISGFAILFKNGAVRTGPYDSIFLFAMFDCVVEREET